MTLTESLISEAVAKNATPELAAHAILAEAELKRGTKVAILSDDIYATEGLIAEVVGPSLQGGQYVDVKLASGTVVPVISTLLAAV